ncbi:hypothetical protein CTI12_AA405760 [Artemisia annua]|uniref:Uncharacterized protein n=1 Tax=Artemisia annua TaxID=35608 RepID=A0A2U1M9B3_ARTAN|nr:hypothetical protein CTI12_AA405760 [Artemisia annua]
MAPKKIMVKSLAVKRDDLWPLHYLYATLLAHPPATILPTPVTPRAPHAIHAMRASPNVAASTTTPEYMGRAAVLPTPAATQTPHARCARRVPTPAAMQAPHARGPRRTSPNVATSTTIAEYMGAGSRQARRPEGGESSHHIDIASFANPFVATMFKGLLLDANIRTFFAGPPSIYRNALQTSVSLPLFEWSNLAHLARSHKFRSEIYPEL